MTNKAKFKSDAFEAIHSAATGLYKAGGMNKTTMREFDKSCLSIPAEIEPQEIKRIRENNHVSQPVFARYLNTSESTIQKWETGAKRPSGMALKLLTIVQKHGLEILTWQLVDLGILQPLESCAASTEAVNKEPENAKQKEEEAARLLAVLEEEQPKNKRPILTLKRKPKV